MQSKGITLALYGVLFVILFSSLYLYCQRREKQMDEEQDRIELENAINRTYHTDIGTGTSTDGGSSFSENSADSDKPEAAVKETRPATPATKPEEKPAEKPAVTPSPAPATPARKEAPKTDAPKQTAAAKPAATATSKWVVRAGTFMYVEGARERLEEVINAGFPDAEIAKTKDGKFTVLVSRTADKAAALRTVEKLENKGVEAAVFTQ